MLSHKGVLNALLLPGLLAWALPAATSDSEASTPGLANAAKAAGLQFFGVGAGLITTRANDAQYSTLLSNTNEFNLISHNTRWESGGFWWAHIEKSPGVYDFSRTDAIVELAERNGQLLRIEGLVHGHQHLLVPRWYLAIGGIPDADYVRSGLERFITAVIHRYKGKLIHWDLIAEPNQVVDINFGIALTPGEYIRIVLKAARKADPDAKLWLAISDLFQYYYDATFEAVLGILQDLKSEGLPVDGISFTLDAILVQYDHASGPDGEHQFYPKVDFYSKLVDRFNRLGELGIQASVSDLAVYVEEPQYVPDLPAALGYQSKIYTDIIKACKDSNACIGISFNGFTDKYQAPYDMGWDVPFPWNAMYEKKPLYDDIFQALQA